jgi:hypothetical protein
MSCYICGGQKESREHAPARCFFPKGMRSDPIVVDSCEKHNEDTSIDDEYVKNIITMMAQNNTTSKKQFNGKTIRSFKRSKPLLTQTIQQIKTVTANGVEQDILEVDKARIDKVMKKIAYAAFFNKYAKRWLRKLAVHTRDLTHENLESDEVGKVISRCDEETAPDFEGSHPEVFQYSFEDIEDPEDATLIMRFYEGFEIWIVPLEEKSEPCL